VALMILTPLQSKTVPACLPGAVLYSLREPSEHFQWLCRDISIINIVFIIITVIIINVDLSSLPDAKMSSCG